MSENTELSDKVREDMKRVYDSISPGARLTIDVRRLARDAATRGDCETVEKLARVYVQLVYNAGYKDEVHRADQTLAAIVAGETPESHDAIILDKLIEVASIYGWTGKGFKYGLVDFFQNMLGLPPVYVLDGEDTPRMFEWIKNNSKSYGIQRVQKVIPARWVGIASLRVHMNPKRTLDDIMTPQQSSPLEAGQCLARMMYEALCDYRVPAPPGVEAQRKPVVG